jgi:hypothetical protein
MYFFLIQKACLKHNLNISHSESLDLQVLAFDKFW